MSQMVYVDASQELVDLLVDNWDESNTNNITPHIDKITNFGKEMSFDDKKGYVLIYSVKISEDSAGLGCPKYAHEFHKLRIDLRVFRDECYFNLLRSEIRRILYLNKINPTTNFNILETANQEIQDLSNRRKLFFQEVRDVDLIKYLRDMTT
jgi:uncharacterized protein YihD (DUF1040 family)